MYYRLIYIIPSHHIGFGLVIAWSRVGFNSRLALVEIVLKKSPNYNRYIERMTCLLHKIYIILIFSLVGKSFSYSPYTNNHISRRKAISTIICSSPMISSYASTANANDATTDADISMLKESVEVLDSLLDNWNKATIDCTYADVPRDLLDAKNKDKLLEKASEFALFDKSASVVTCKRVNGVVRDYIGSTGKGPLVNIEKRLLRSNVVDRIDPDNLDAYFSSVESFSQLLSRAKTLSYSAGHNDFDSMNNFVEGEESGGGSKILDETKVTIDEANQDLKRALSFIIQE